MSSLDPHRAREHTGGRRRLSIEYDRAVTENGDAIVLQGIEVPAALGVSKAERDMRRPVAIDLELACDLERSGKSDRLRDTIDYGDLYRTVEQVAGTQEHRLVEALAERIATALLDGYPLLACTVRIRKRGPVAGNLRWAGVRITRTRA